MHPALNVVVKRDAQGSMAQRGKPRDHLRSQYFIAFSLSWRLNFLRFISRFNRMRAKFVIERPVT